MEMNERIVRLLDGELSADEVRELEEQIKLHPELELDKDHYQQIMLAIREKSEQDLRGLLDGYLEEYKANYHDEGYRPFNKYLFLGGVAASLAIVMLFFYTSKEQSPVQLPSHIDKEHSPIQASADSMSIDSILHYNAAKKVEDK